MRRPFVSINMAASVDGKITSAQADELIALANAIIGSLEAGASGT